MGSADLESYVCLVDDPRQEHVKGKKIGIEHLGNVAGGDPTEYLNVPNQFMKDCVRQILQEQGIPVWFGADCHPMMDRENGAWATDLFEYGCVYGVDFDLDKEQRVRFGDSAMNHAMAFVGVDVDEDGHTTRRWRVENSWGRQDRRQGLLHHERRLVHRIRLRGRRPQGPPSRRIPQGPRRTRHHAPRVGSDRRIGRIARGARAGQYAPSE